MEDSDGNSDPGDWESPNYTGVDYAALRALEQRGHVDDGLSPWRLYTMNLRDRLGSAFIATVAFATVA